MKKITVTQTSMPPYEDYIEKIKPLWDTKWLTNMGTYHKELELKLKEYLEVPYLSLMVNGHMALEMAIQSFDFPKESEVITTPFTFISTTHAIVRNELKPVFCDIKEDDYTIDETKIEALITDKTVAIVPVHVYGNICNVEEIQRIADKHGLKVIYDAAHAFGEKYKGIGVGNFGDVSIFSFHATKVYNTIEGGAVTFKEPAMYERLYNLKNFGIRGEEVVADVGANAKMNEFCAIMGLCNLPLVADHIEARKAKTLYYLEQLGGCDGVKFLDYDNTDLQRNYGYLPVFFDNQEIRDTVWKTLRDKNIFSRKYFYPLTADAECFDGLYQNAELEVARRMSSNVLVLPLYPELEKEEIDMIGNLIKNTLEEKYGKE